MKRTKLRVSVICSSVSTGSVEVIGKKEQCLVRPSRVTHVNVLYQPDLQSINRNCNKDSQDVRFNNFSVSLQFFSDSP